MIVHDCDPYSPEYWRLKQGKASCSEFHRIVTPKKWEFADGAKTYAQEIIAQDYDYAYGQSEGYVSAAMRNGIIFEPESRNYYEMKRDCEVRRVGLVVSDCGRFAYSPDSLVGDEGAVELKNPTPAVHIKWLLAGGIPPEHLAQCHGGLLVGQLKWIDFLSYCRRLPPLLVRLYPDEKTEALAESLEQFWKMLTEMREKIEAAHDPMANIPAESYVSPF